MADIIAQGQENVQRLEQTFQDAPIVEVPTDYLCESRNNPRRHISTESVKKMVNGIQQAGGVILQPLLIRPIGVTPEGWRYEVICGNRRLRAARHPDLLLNTVPVRVREMDDETAARFALWENLSREDLNPMDLAESIDDLRKIDKLSWDEIGERFGFSRQWGWQQQKLAELPGTVRDLVREGDLSPSTAMLIAREETTEEAMIALARRVVSDKLSHRDLTSELRCKHVLTSLEVGSEVGSPLVSTARPSQVVDECKHVLTWSTPIGFSGKKHARLRRATEEIVEAVNLGTLQPGYAKSLRTLAERILSLAESAEDGE